MEITVPRTATGGDSSFPRRRSFDAAMSRRRSLGQRLDVAGLAALRFVDVESFRRLLRF